MNNQNNQKRQRGLKFFLASISEVKDGESAHPPQKAILWQKRKLVLEKGLQPIRTY